MLFVRRVFWKKIAFRAPSPEESPRPSTPRAAPPKEQSS